MYIYILLKHDTAKNTNDISWIPFPIGNISFYHSFFHYVIHNSIVSQFQFHFSYFIIIHYIEISIPSPKESIIYNNLNHFLFPTALTAGFTWSLSRSNNNMYLYAYSINHKDPPQRHHRIPALSQRQLFHEWPAPLFIHIIPTLHIHIIDIHYSYSVYSSHYWFIIHKI